MPYKKRDSKKCKNDLSYLGYYHSWYANIQNRLKNNHGFYYYVSAISVYFLFFFKKEFLASFSFFEYDPFALYTVYRFFLQTLYLQGRSWTRII